MDRRGSIANRRAPGRFRCLPCKRYVHGTESGHCPNCGFVPPSAPELPDAVGSSIQAWLVMLVVLVLAIALYVFMQN